MTPKEKANEIYCSVIYETEKIDYKEKWQLHANRILADLTDDAKNNTEYTFLIQVQRELDNIFKKLDKE